MRRHLLESEDATRRARTISEAAIDKGGLETVVLDVSELLGIADLFVITSGANSRQIRTIVDELQQRVARDDGGKPRSVEGLEDLEWVLLDYGDVVVHVFSREARDFYALDRLWADAPRVDEALPATTNAGGAAG